MCYMFRQSLSEELASVRDDNITLIARSNTDRVFIEQLETELRNVDQLSRNKTTALHTEQEEINNLRAHLNESLIKITNLERQILETSEIKDIKVLPVAVENKIDNHEPVVAPLHIKLILQSASATSNKWKVGNSCELYFSTSFHKYNFILKSRAHLFHFCHFGCVFFRCLSFMRWISSHALTTTIVLPINKKLSVFYTVSSVFLHVKFASLSVSAIIKKAFFIILLHKIIII